MACLFHKWNGCTCEKCGKIRTEGHRYVNSYCEICGQRSPFPVDTSELTPEEVAELKPVLVGYAQYCGNRSGGDRGTRLSLTYSKYNAYEYCRKDTEYTFCNSAVGASDNLEVGVLNLIQARIAVAAARSTIQMLEHFIGDARPSTFMSDDSGTLTALEAQAPASFSSIMAQQKELYQTGMSLSANQHQTAIRGTIALLGPAADKIERAIGRYQEELARRGDTDEEDIDMSLN